MKVKSALFFSLVAWTLLACYGSGGPIKSPAVGMALNASLEGPNREAAMKNNEGVSHLKQEHWETAADYLGEALQMDPNLAEAHFNLGLVLDELGQHEEASQHFRKAKELAPDNPKIAENEVLLKHL